ncbi:hypothetical protein FNV43_RR24922 [Rhamnella rubrinervis]|uniref:Uncharacterized protein n=1 Tax=Rhamnella rubrinervis TaxID=2594499 RepID=A0A8K0DTI5_9ROSA|nr:hypothetical protein FNV43_RR24922 [Rhamnella rubrinervis]
MDFQYRISHSSFCQWQSKEDNFWESREVRATNNLGKFRSSFVIEAKMGCYRDQSPDWLRAFQVLRIIILFQAPTHSSVTLSSGSESSRNGSPSGEEGTNWDESSLCKSSKIQGDSSAETLSNERSRSKSPEKGKRPKIEDQVLEKNKSGNPKKRKGDSGRKKVRKKIKVENPVETHVRNYNVNIISYNYPTLLLLPGDRLHVLLGQAIASLLSLCSLSIMMTKIVYIEQEMNNSVWALSSDSDLCPDSSPVRENQLQHGESSDQKTSQLPWRGMEEEECGKLIEPQVSSSRLPLVPSEKVHRSKVDGDMGAVGRIVISDSLSGNHEMYLDLKGTIYKTTIVPSRTFCIVSFGQSEAKTETIMNDFNQLKPESNVYEAETMVEGTLDGFSFDSEEEGDKILKPTSNQTDHNEDVEEQHSEKSKGKS